MALTPPMTPNTPSGLARTARRPKMYHGVVTALIFPPQSPRKKLVESVPVRVHAAIKAYGTNAWTFSKIQPFTTGDLWCQTV